MLILFVITKMNTGMQVHHISLVNQWELKAMQLSANFGSERINTFAWRLSY